MITSTHLSEMIPQNLIPILLGTPDTKEATEDQIVANVFKQRDLREFVREILSQLKSAEEAKRQTWRSQHLILKIMRHPLYGENAPAGFMEVPPLLERTTPQEFGTFPQELLALPAMAQRVLTLSARQLYEARQISESMKRDEKTDPRIPKSFDFNSSGRSLGLSLPWNDVDTPFQSFRLGALPKTLEEASSLFQVALGANDHLFVSLHESNEHQRDRISDFWENRTLQRLTIPGWKVLKTDERVLAQETSGSASQKTVKIVESTLRAVREDGSETRVLTHLHLDGWPDASPLPSEDLFYTLQSRMAQISPLPQDRILINCIGGVGRTGTTAVARYCRQYIDFHRSQGHSLDSIRLNIPEIIYSMRSSQRHNLVGQASHLPNLYSFVDRYYTELKAQAK